MGPRPGAVADWEATWPMDRREFIGGVVASAALGAAGGIVSGCAVPAKRVVLPPKGPDGALASFGVSESALKKVMARALGSGGDYCELFFQRRRTNSLRLQDGAVNSASKSSDLGVGIRVVRGLETGYAFTESLDLASMVEGAGVAAAIARGPAGVAAQAFRVGKTASYYDVRQDWPQVATKEKVALLMRLQGMAAGADPRIRKVNLSYRDEDSHILVVDSAGRLFTDYQPMTVCYLSCVAEHKGRTESNYGALAGRAGFEFYDETRLKRIVEQTVRRTTVLFDAVAGPVGELPVVLAPGSSGILLHEAIGHGMEADFARQKTTIFADMIGKKVAEPFVTIIDDGTVPTSRGSINIDDEGNTSMRTALVEGGVLRGFMHDRISSNHFKVEATGNGRRESFRHVPLPRMRNTYMLAGPHAPEEIIRSVKKGIYAEHFTNGQVKIGEGDYSFYIKNGMLIEDGKLTRPIKDINIIGNGPQSLARVSMVGNDFAMDEGGWTCGKSGQGVPVGLGMPTVKVSAITVGGTTKAGA